MILEKQLYCHAKMEKIMHDGKRTELPVTSSTAKTNLEIAKTPKTSSWTLQISFNVLKM